ncbi:sodium:solute symporter family protein [Planosporangium thailandense]|uniref:Sodium:solute symporter family protein n=1 Tax=Planosporangium thailandense TaxID=765197 RepID=A0ABX0Y6H9_9ACTN|nr:sodium:solute symporter family protein [Planosporangium thailandense]
MPRFQDHYPQFVIFVILFATVTVLGFASARWRRPHTLDSLDEWGLGGRSFGSWNTWFLLGGDLYTAYTFVALPALMFGAGAVGFFAVPYTVMGYPLLFLPLLRLWSVSHVHGFVTTSDFVRARFASPTLALLVALTSIVATIPYVALNMVGIEAVFKTMGLTGRWPVTLAFLVLAIYTYRAGLRAPALIALVKDALVCFTIVAAVLVLPFAQGGWGNVFHRTAARFDETGSTMAGLLLNSNQHLNFITLAIGSALGTFMYPHAMTGLLAARSRTTVKHNMIALPVFSILLGMLCLLGYIALTEDVQPVGADPAHGRIGDLNTVVPRLFDQIGPPWFAGVAFATIGIAALVPAAIMAIGAANLFARNVYREFIHPEATAAQEARVSKVVSLLVKFGAVSLVLFLDPQFSIDMQLIGGVVIMQVVPTVILGLYTRWLHRWGLTAGLIVGLLAGIVMIYQIPERGGPHGAIIRAHWGGSSYPLWHFGLDTQVTVYAGFVAFLLNLVVAIAATVVLRAAGVPTGHDRTRPEDYTADAGDPRIDKLSELSDGELAVAARSG